MDIRLVDLPPSEAAAHVVAGADANWTRRFVDELDRRVHAEPLERLVRLWGLSNAGAGRMFGVSRQAFTKWLQSGPPPDRAAHVADLAAATDVLDRHLRRGPDRRRRPTSGDGARRPLLLELAEQGRSREVLDKVRAMFDLRRVQP